MPGWLVPGCLLRRGLTHGKGPALPGWRQDPRSSNAAPRRVHSRTGSGSRLSRDQQVSEHGREHLVTGCIRVQPVGRE
jgi:hypothetical protein